MPTQREMIEGYPALAAHADRLEQALHDTLTGQVTWSGWHSVPGYAGRYRAGICRVDTDPIVIVAFRTSGQSDLTYVYGLEPYLTETHRVRFISPGVQPILDAITDAQAKVAGLKRGQDACLTAEV